MMKPWQTLLNKAPNKGGKQKQREREREREDPSPRQKHKNPQGVTKGESKNKERERGPKSLAESTKTHRESQRGKGTTICSRAPTGLKKHIRKENGKETCSHKTIVVILAAYGKPFAWALLQHLLSIASLQWAKLNIYNQ
jgi:hypothetical protein